MKCIAYIFFLLFCTRKWLCLCKCNMCVCLYCRGMHMYREDEWWRSVIASCQKSFPGPPLPLPPVVHPSPLPLPSLPFFPILFVHFICLYPPAFLPHPVYLLPFSFILHPSALLPNTPPYSTTSPIVNHSTQQLSHSSPHFSLSSKHKTFDTNYIIPLSSCRSV